MSYWEALLFGIVQGLTEFLPISSTAHLVIVQHLLGLEFPGLAFEIFLHLGSVLAVIFYFRADLQSLIAGFFRYLAKRKMEDRPHFFFGLYIVVATLITGSLGLLLQKMIGDALKSPLVIAAALATTGVFLLLIERYRKEGGRDAGQMGWRDAVLVGLGQTIAVLPGISRSGATLIVALGCGLSRDTAVRYSFLLSIPIILGSCVLAVGEVDAAVIARLGVGPLLLAFIACLLCSVAGIVWLIAFLKRSKLFYFAIYCFVAAAGVFFFLDRDLKFELETAPVVEAEPAG